MPTLSDVKKRIGFQPRTHYKTILASPQRLAPLLPANASIADVKTTMLFLVRASPKEVADRRLT
jgi:adenylate kinase